jgi:hypothetical protein
MINDIDMMILTARTKMKATRMMRNLTQIRNSETMQGSMGQARSFRRKILVKEIYPIHTH